MRIVFWWSIITFMLLSALPASAQQQALAAVLAGKSAPLTLVLKQLDGSWRCISPAPTADAAETLVRFIVAENNQQPWVSEVMYTHGDTLMAAGETYLVAYARPPQPLPEMGRGNRGGGAASSEALGPDTEIYLTLLNIRTMGSLLNIHPFDLPQEMARTKTTLEDNKRQSLNNLRQVDLALLMYAQDHNNTMPATDNLAQWQAGLKIDPQALLQPGCTTAVSPQSRAEQQGAPGHRRSGTNGDRL